MVYLYFRTEHLLLYTVKRSRFYRVFGFLCDHTIANLTIANTTITTTNSITPRTNDDIGPSFEGLGVGTFGSDSLGTGSVGAGVLGEGTLGEGLDEEPPPEPEPEPPLLLPPPLPEPPPEVGFQLAVITTLRSGIVKVAVELVVLDKDTLPSVTVQPEKV